MTIGKEGLQEGPTFRAWPAGRSGSARPQTARGSTPGASPARPSGIPLLAGDHEIFWYVGGPHYRTRRAPPFDKTAPRACLGACPARPSYLGSAPRGGASPARPQTGRGSTNTPTPLGHWPLPQPFPVIDCPATRTSLICVRTDCAPPRKRPVT